MNRKEFENTVNNFFREAVGVKADAGKTRWDLMPWREIEEVAGVMTHGAKKYSDNNWMKVRNKRARYFAAAMRHMVAWRAGERVDSESGRYHLAHAVCCMLFLMWTDRNKR